MKTIFPLILLVTGVTAALGQPAFTEPPAPAAPPPTLLFRTDWAPMPRTNSSPTASIETEILSRRADFDLKGRFAVYQGNVRVKDPRMDLTCDKMTVRMSAQSAGKFDNVVAERNVSIDVMDQKGGRIHGTGGRAVYTYNVVPGVTNYNVIGNVTNYHIAPGVTNDIIELFENPMLETPQGTLKGDVITMDRGNNTIRATNSRMVIRPATGDSNAPALAPMMPSPAR